MVDQKLNETVKEIRAARENLATQIAEAINTFQQQTGVAITAI